MDGRVALVTGGNGGLGWAMANALRRAGADVAIGGRDQEKNRAAAEVFGPEMVFGLDVRDEDAVGRTIEDVVRRMRHLDILVNNAGNFRGAEVGEMSLEQWRSVIDTHLTGTFLCSKHAVRAMVARGEGGKIVNIGSMYSIFGPPAFANYAAAKTGILGITRALAVELAVEGIQVNAILPGWFETALTHGAPNTPWGERIRAKTPAGRWGKPEDLTGRWCSCRAGPPTSSPAWRSRWTAATRLRIGSCPSEPPGRRTAYAPRPWIS